MAARIGNALVDKIFDSSDASKAFKTSWNQGREFVLYGLIALGKKWSSKSSKNLISIIHSSYTLISTMLSILLFLGIVTLPMAMFLSTPLYCEICKKFPNDRENCKFMKSQNNFSAIIEPGSNPGYFGGWVNKYCTMNAVDDVTLYFPYLMMIIPLIMISIEKGFDK